MRTLWQDIRYGVRMLRKSPGFTATALITLAVGIGANTLSFSVADALLLRPVGVKDPQQLVCWGISESHLLIDHSAYLTISENKQAFSEFMAQDEGRTVTLTSPSMAGRAEALFVSGNYFSFLGVVPVRGRGFLPEEDRQDAAPVVVLSHRFWQRRGADPTIVGQSLRVNGVPCQVVGVAPEGFTGITLAGPDLWLPLGSYLSTMVLARGKAQSPEPSGWNEYPLPLIPIGRLKPGVSLAGAQASLPPVAARLKAQFPRHWIPRSTLYLYRAPRIGPWYASSQGGAASRALLRSQMMRYSFFLLGVSGTILVIACFNLGNMLMIRGTGRGREIALRLALGGGRLRIIRQLLIEALLLALLGGVLGLFLAFWGTALLNTWLAASQQLRWRCLQTGLNPRVLAMTLGVGLLATVLFGLRPALGLSRRDVMGELKESGSALPGPVKGRRGGLPVFCQIALTVVLVMIAVMFTRRALVLARPDESFHPENTLVVELDPLSAGYDRTRSIQACQMLADRLETLPGVASVGTSPSFSFGNNGVDSIYTYVPGAQDSDSERLLATGAASPPVGRDYFRAVGLPLLQGRSLSRLDSTADAENVVIIDEYLARRMDPNGQVLDAWIRFGWFSERSEPYRIVGVVARIGPSTHNPHAAVQTYKPAQPDQMCPVFYLRMKDPRAAPALKRRVLAALRQVDPYVPVLSITTLADKRRNHGMVWFAAMCVRLTGTAGAIALFLAALGIWAVKGFMVASRTHEIGIRKALGATHREIVGMVFKEGFLLTAAGLLAGLLLGWGATRIVAGALYGYKAIDPVGMAVSVVLLGTVSFLAGYFPARRAARIDPMVALRYE